MGFFSRFEGKMEDAVEGAAGGLSHSPISPVQIAKKCEKQMVRARMVGAGKQYAPTLYTVLVNPDDDERLFSFYPTLAGETETYLRAKAGEQGLYMDGQPLVRFIVDDGLRHGKFDVIAEVVASSIISQLRQEEMERYGLVRPQAQQRPAYQPQPARPSYDEQPYDDPYSAEAYDDYGASNDPNDPYAPPAQDPYAPATQDPYAESAADPYASPAQDPFAPSTPDPYAAPTADAYDDYAANAADMGAMGAAAAGAGAAYAAGAGAASAMPAGATRVLPSNDEMQAGQFAAHLMDLTNGKTYALTKPLMVAGRANECDIVISDINASRRHAEFSRQSHGVWVVRDLGSKNGTVLNGQAIYEPTTLYEGDRLTMGLTEYKFTMA